MTLVLPYEYEVFDWSLAWRTSVLKSWSGLEHRSATLTWPRERYSIQYLLDEDDDNGLRDQRRLFYQSPAEDRRIPLRHERLVAQGAVTGASATVDATYSDHVASGLVVLVENPRGQTYAATVTGVAGPVGARVLTLDASPPVGENYPAGSWVHPTALVGVDDGSRLARYQEEAGTLTVTGADRDFRATWGTGASLALHGGLPVVDRLLLGSGLQNERLAAGLERLDQGAGTDLRWSRSVSDTVREHSFTVGNDQGFEADRQWWKLFLSTVRGRQKVFVLPTWRDDLVLTAQPGLGATTLLVRDDERYDLLFAASLAHRRLHLVFASGATQVAGVAAVAAPSGGSTSVTLTNAVASSSPILRVSHAETCRLEDDEVTLRFQSGAPRASLSASFRVVQQ